MLISDPSRNVPTRTAGIRDLSRVLNLTTLLLVTIVIVGGMTRLSGAGLSITDWKPVTGIIPPLTDAQWETEFKAYRAIPQFEKVTGPAGMGLADYKVIYFWEWAHRLLARLIGAVLLLSIAWLWIGKRIPEGYGARMAGLLCLVSIQGGAGWWMVTSGLTQDIKVSHLRLAVHLALALVTLACTVWTALDLWVAKQDVSASTMPRLGWIALAALFIQVVLGAMVAGLPAGHVAGAGWGNFEAWPQMQGKLFPAGIDWSRGTAFAALHDPYLVHFLHRWWAWILLIVLGAIVRGLLVLERRKAAFAISGLVGVQLVLGVATVWSAVPIWLAAGHQFVAAMLLCATIWGLHELGRR